MLDFRLPIFFNLSNLHFTKAMLIVLAISALLSACTPTYDWRDVRGTETPYSVLMPSKPSTHTREINLGGIRASMTMRATEVESITFAVGSAELPDAAQAKAALQVMKNTMVANIGGTIRVDQSRNEQGLSIIDLVAGPQAGADSNAKALHARFIAKGRRVYQVLVVGPEKSIRIDNVDMFLGSFKPE